MSHGGIGVSTPQEYSDENGSVILATIKTYGDTTHTFVERSKYKGLFLPGYHKHHSVESLNNILDPIKFERVDHIVGNQPDLMMEPAVKYYE